MQNTRACKPAGRMTSHRCNHATSRDVSLLEQTVECATQSQRGHYPAYADCLLQQVSSGQGTLQQQLRVVTNESKGLAIAREMLHIFKCVAIIYKSYVYKCIWGRVVLDGLQMVVAAARWAQRFGETCAVHLVSRNSRE
jgi:hypothetical protein